MDLRLPTDIGLTLQTNVPLAGYTTMKVGGRAEYFATVNTVAQLTALVRWARTVGLPYFLLGGGSNILISDQGIDGLVIDNRCRGLHFTPENGLVAESGVALAGAARRSVNAGLHGLEWAVSVPGTIGGAVVNNAGAHGGEVKDNLVEARVLDGDGKDIRYGLTDFAYAYRASSLKRQRLLQADFKPVVLTATFQLQPGDKEAIREEADRYLRHRRSTQPAEASLGSTFVNPPGEYAGRLIEAAGLKGRRVGGVEVSNTHANFIINPGGVGTATARDVIDLIDLIRREVAEQFDIRLEPEVQLAGNWPDNEQG